MKYSTISAFLVISLVSFPCLRAYECEDIQSLEKSRPDNWRKTEVAREVMQLAFSNGYQLADLYIEIISENGPGISSVLKRFQDMNSNSFKESLSNLRSKGELISNAATTVDKAKLKDEMLAEFEALYTSINEFYINERINWKREDRRYSEFNNVIRDLQTKC